LGRIVFAIYVELVVVVFCAVNSGGSYSVLLFCCAAKSGKEGEAVGVYKLPDEFLERIISYSSSKPFGALGVAEPGGRPFFCSY
jgi:hypothetical protein